ncbi:MAG TPA: hypothetical protein VHB02_00275 [Acidimicrobiales bacterium]|nr:hypothetical protein [Acidimicrobiales bacterium]
MGSPVLPDGTVTDGAAAYEPFTLPDDGYRDRLLALLALQAAPMWSVGQQAAYQEFVMSGPTLEHWVRVSGAWAEVERNIWELNGLLGHLGVGSWEGLVGAPADAAAVGATLGTWVDVLLAEQVADGLGAAMARACVTSSYAPLARTARLLAYGKAGSQASGVVGIKEMLVERQVPRAQVEDRAAVWLDLVGGWATRYGDAQSAEGFGRGLAQPVDVAAEMAAVKAELNGLLEAAS